jgi:hypothetical protein
MEFVNCNLAKKLQEKGFPQVKKGTLAMYDDDGCIYHLCPTLNRFYYAFDDFDEHDCVCPTIPQILKWLRAEFSFHISTKPYPCEDGLMWMYEVRKFKPHINRYE